MATTTFNLCGSTAIAMSLEDAAYDLQAIDSSKISKWKIIEHNLGASKECSQKTEVSVESFPNGMLSFRSNSYASFNKQETLEESNDCDLHQQKQDLNISHQQHRLLVPTFAA